MWVILKCSKSNTRDAVPRITQHFVSALHADYIGNNYALDTEIRIAAPAGGRALNARAVAALAGARRTRRRTHTHAKITLRAPAGSCRRITRARPEAGGRADGWKSRRMLSKSPLAFVRFFFNFSNDFGGLIATTPIRFAVKTVGARYTHATNRRTGAPGSARPRPAARPPTTPSPRPSRSPTSRSPFSGRPGCRRSAAGPPPW